ncbi:unnamed protein product [Owenia fusiformis]|uniref:Uncharacterized protein n=1 Tax=Owenia fusiformis TaxID=6347 RepID=A0A8J1TRV5_OWEFU|nr:unnamed protein product [Owenia fusiformis]
MKPGDCSDVEKLLFDRVQEGNVSEVKRLLGEPKVRVDCIDESGMTMLQHAAFKGRLDLVELLLSQGADVNSNYHDNQYSTLTFGALSGNADVVKALLIAGADTKTKNSVGRTAAQMAGFTGQHHVVATINNYFPIDYLEPYIKIQGLDKEPRLPPHLAPLLHKMMLFTNLHPVHISRYLKQTPVLLDEAYKIAKVLDLLCEKSMKAADTNDVMAIKSHYLACVIRQCDKARTERGDTNLDTWIKSLIRCREGDMCNEYMEKFIRSTMRDFPYTQSELLQTMVRNLAAVPVGGNPTGFSILMSAVNGQQYAPTEDTACDTCGEPHAEKKCSACKYVHYCNAECQKLQWFTHKKFCKHLGEVQKKYTKQEEERMEREKREQEIAKSKQIKNIQMAEKDPENIKDSNEVTPEADSKTDNPSEVIES